MSDCVPSETSGFDDLPVGSPPITDPASPCFEPSVGNIFELTRNMNERLCAVEAQKSQAEDRLASALRELQTLREQVRRVAKRDSNQESSGVCGISSTSKSGGDIMSCRNGSPILIGQLSNGALRSDGERWNVVPRGAAFFARPGLPRVISATHVWSSRPGTGTLTSDFESEAVFRDLPDVGDDAEIYALIRARASEVVPYSEGNLMVEVELGAHTFIHTFPASIYTGFEEGTVSEAMFVMKVPPGGRQGGVTWDTGWAEFWNNTSKTSISFKVDLNVVGYFA